MSNRQIACFLLSYSRGCGAVSFAANLQQRMDPAIPRGRVSKNICHWWELHVLDDVTAPLVKTRRNCRSPYPQNCAANAQRKPQRDHDEWKRPNSSQRRCCSDIGSHFIEYNWSHCV